VITLKLQLCRGLTRTIGILTLSPILNFKFQNVRQSDMNLSPLALLCSRILLVRDGVYCLPYNGWTLGDLPTKLVCPPCQVERRFHNWKSNRQPLHLKLDTSPLSSGSLGSSRTTPFETCFPCAGVPVGG
jgi:hypothetical protein